MEIQWIQDKKKKTHAQLYISRKSFFIAIDIFIISLIFIIYNLLYIYISYYNIILYIIYIIKYKIIKIYIE